MKNTTMWLLATGMMIPIICGYTYGTQVFHGTKAEAKRMAEIITERSRFLNPDEPDHVYKPYFIITDRD